MNYRAYANLSVTTAIVLENNPEITRVLIGLSSAFYKIEYKSRDDVTQFKKTIFISLILFS